MTSLLDLTPREIEILKLFLSGRTNKVIAAGFCITAKTVEFHLDHISTKIGMHTRMITDLLALQQDKEVETREIPS
jgi:DNA-binding CsgD family transcriptional regulator